jgi:hypothetical protein
VPTQTGTYTLKVEGTLTNTSIQQVFAYSSDGSVELDTQRGYGFGEYAASDATGTLTAFANIATLAGVMVFSGNADRATAAGEQGVLGTYEREVTLVAGTTYRIGTFFGGNTGIEAPDDTLTISLNALPIVEESFSPHAVTFRGSAPANPAFIKALEDVAPVADGINVVYEQL